MDRTEFANLALGPDRVCLADKRTLADRAVGVGEGVEVEENVE